MTTLNVQFTDSTDAVILSYFAGHQDPEVYPNQGTVESSDDRWKVFFETLPSAVQSTLPAPE